jgi:hypothetical protein
MAKEWEITGRLGELQMQWLKQHYSQEQLDQALASLPEKKRGFPLNVAKLLQAAGGPAMPSPAELLSSDPQTRQRAAAARAEAIARIERLKATLLRK